MRTASLRLLLSALLLAFLISACGKKGPVRPRLEALPEAPGEVTLTQQGEELLLRWKIPSNNQDGSPLTDLAGFRVYRMRYEPQDACPECFDTSVLWRSVDLEYLRGARRSGDRLVVTDHGLQAGTGYRYRVVPVTERGMEGESASAERPYFPPPPSPSEVRKEEREGLIRLDWQPPSSLPGASVLVGYNLYRAESEAPFPPHPLNRRTIEATTYEDFAVKEGVKYRYGLRTVIRYGDWRVESFLSAPLSAAPRSGR